ncbi:MAG: dehydrogenase [Verrucomicrobiales bacterium]|nr:dehydrogenase [Verrucomicrobiales bacterium]|tara:strand:- start:4113 stop:5072 length:960 start_codon:yes stop_codon:yes gene_type:complete
MVSRTFKAFGVLVSLIVGTELSAAELRIGMIGLDTSHVVAFTELLNNPDNPKHVPGGRVVAAFKGGSPDVEASHTRVDRFTATLQEKYGVKIYPTIKEMVKHVDAVMLESVDGRPHLRQAIPVMKAGKPMYIEKPMAASLKDVREIFRRSKRHDSPVFSSSCLRYAKTTQAVRNGKVGRVHYCLTQSPAKTEPHHPELFWYGIHGCEALFTVMGTGCQKVKREVTEDGKVKVTGFWEGNRFGVFIEGRNVGYALGEDGRAEAGNHERYQGLVQEIIKFFNTGKNPIPEKETIELFAFMEAADLSRERGGEWVELSEVLE